MALQESTFQIGNSVAPLTITGNTLLQDCDPAVFYMLDFFRFILDQYFLTRWAVEAVAAGLNVPITSTVAEYVSYDPTPFFQTAQYKFPLLAMYRIDETYEEKTRSFFHAQSQLKVLYALPPLEASQYNKLSPILVRMARAILDRSEQGWDPGYNNSQLVYQSALLEEVKVEKATFGSIQKIDKSNLFFPAFEMTFNVIERRNLVPDSYDNLTGIDGYVKIADGDTVLDFVEFDQDLT